MASLESRLGLQAVKLRPRLLDAMALMIACLCSQGFVAPFLEEQCFWNSGTVSATQVYHVALMMAIS